MSSDKSVLFLHAWRVLATGAPVPVAEYNFDKELKRKHRFDFAWIDQRVAVEINGNAWHTQGGGRHGQDADLEKLNIAISLGWKVFQLSPAMIKNDPARWVEMILNEVQR